jgi:hypothetical protein
MNDSNSHEIEEVVNEEDGKEEDDSFENQFETN